MTFIERLRKRINRLSRVSGMFNRTTTIPQAYEKLLKDVLSAKLRDKVREQLLISIFALKANCSQQLYSKLLKVENNVFK